MAKKDIKGNPKKGLVAQVQPKGASNQPSSQNAAFPKDFEMREYGPLILVHFSSPKAQHQALARVETFYESGSDASNYISLQNPKTKLMCRNYEAFNMPILAIKEWLQAMKISEKALSRSQHNADPYSFPGWWRSFTNLQESNLLDQLWRCGCLKALKDGENPVYLISFINKSAVHHDLLHALYFLHPGYQDMVRKQWLALSKPCRLVITHELLMRGYGEHVWIDEFQAYVSEDQGCFGKKVTEECHQVRLELRAAQSLAWEELDLNVASIFQM
ncbi:enhancer of mRNA decapping [Gnomoniopsis smithogilvyi]|uniref:Enhancer of mRNA decapping n=1 Tax=Gnomoniopsis smithogilvyi TaxID=1191159 RepID=A0A9W9CU06_9PEZI|nr:enhancer of mRNA decapping [Gnomoniopsis smithogilvyi]